MKKQNVMTFVLLLLMTTIWWPQAQPSHFLLWPGGGQAMHNIRVKQPYYNAHMNIITIIIVMGRFSVPSHWSVCLAKGTVAQSCDSGRSHWLLNHSCSWWLIVYHRVRRPRASKYTNEMPQPIQMSKGSGVPPGKKALTSALLGNKVTFIQRLAQKPKTAQLVAEWELKCKVMHINEGLQKISWVKIHLHICKCIFSHLGKPIESTCILYAQR